MTDIRQLEKESIRAFVQQAADDGLLSGRVIDIGSGRQPYREIVETAGGEYVPYDSPTFPASLASRDTTGESWGCDFDAALCLQVIQYQEDPEEFLNGIRYQRLAQEHGVLLLTWPSAWPEVEQEDLRRYTRMGMNRILVDSGFSIVQIVQRGQFEFGKDSRWCLGWGAICRA